MSNITAELVVDDFVSFLRLLFNHLGFDPPTPAQVAIAKRLQHGPLRQQLTCFRGVGKSVITSAFVLWTLYRDPEKKILVISASSDRSKDFTRFCLSMLSTVPWLNSLAPVGDQRQSSQSFDVGSATPSQVPSVKSVGITSQITGSRANLIILDDVEVPSNSATDALREKLLNQVKETESILLPLPDSRIIFLGTPQTAFTIYDTLSGSYEPYVWPARYPDPSTVGDGYISKLAPDLADNLDADPSLVGKPTDTRFSDETLSERERIQGRSMFQLQFMLDTSLSDAEKYPLKFRDLVVMSLAEQVPVRITWSGDRRYELPIPAVGLPGDRFHEPMHVSEDVTDDMETIVSIDPAGRGADETCACVLSQSNGYVFLRDMLAFNEPCYDPASVRRLLELGKRYDATTFLVESNWGDGMISNQLERAAAEMNYSVKVDEVRATQRKELRIISSLEPVMNSHKLIVDPKVWEYDFRSRSGDPSDKRLEYMLMYQMSRMTSERGAVKHDDRVDALAQGVLYFSEAFRISDQLEEKHREQEHKDAMDRLWENSPHLATDALVLGLDPVFLDKNCGRGRIWDWTPKS